MRSDYALYVVAVICFILAAAVFAGSTEYAGYLPMETQITMITTAVLAILGIISAGAGYLVRPGEMILAPPPPPPPKPAPERSTPPTPQSKTTVTSPIEITEVKGIGSKRAEQLRALGINTAQDLAKTTANT